MAKFISNKPAALKAELRVAEAVSGGRDLAGALSRLRVRLRSGVSDQALADLFDHLATLLTSGIPMIKSLELVCSSTSHAELRGAVERIVQKLRMGRVLSEALEDEKAIFPAVVRGMIRAAEASGRMDHILKELAESFARRAETKSRVLQALAYPFMILGFGLITLAVLICFVIPKLSVVFELWDTELPLVTRLLLSISGFMASGGWIIFPVLIVAGMMGVRMVQSRNARWLPNLLARLPLFSRLFFLVNFTRLTRTWGMLMRSGVPILESLRSSREVLEHSGLNESLVRIQEASARGVRLQESVGRETSFPQLARDYLAIGEETGTLDQSFDKIADYYDRELARHLKMMTTLLEPVLILIIGVVVGFLVISLLLPIFEMSLVVR